MPPPAGAMAAARAALLPSASSTPSPLLRLPRRFFSLTATPYPLYYDLIVHRPADPNPPKSSASDAAGADRQPHAPPDEQPLDRAKRRYLRKRRSRLLPDPDATTTTKPSSSSSSEFVELRPEVVDFPRLHAREEALYFHDTFAMPWEKDKHYRMLYRLEKKYFPHQSLDNAFVPADAAPASDADRSLVFFDDEKKEDEGQERVVSKKGGDSDDKGEVLERKVEDFFRSLKKGPGQADTKVKRPGAESRQVKREVPREEERPQPYLVTRTTELPPRWDGPAGTVVLIDKPKGWTSFTVCGKLRRLVKVQKVGHAGTLDPMATGLLIVCVGKATKIVDSYQGMVKGYSGVFRLGEATSTWDADSPVIQREPWEHIKDEGIRKAAASFKGEIWQVPPMFSAIKVGGEKMYDKARRGETVELSPRRISIYQFDIERSLEDRQNLIFRVTCSKGTYIRSLCADLGKALGSCAHLTALRRDSIGNLFNVPLGAHLTPPGPTARAKRRYLHKRRSRLLPDPDAATTAKPSSSSSSSEFVELRPEVVDFQRLHTRSTSTTPSPCRGRRTRTTACSTASRRSTSPTSRLTMHSSPPTPPRPPMPTGASSSSTTRRWKMRERSGWSVRRAGH